MAKRFIDAEKLNYLMCSIYWGEDEEGNDVYRRAEVAFRTDIEQIPTADVVEIPDSGIGDISDGYHTFNELYHHRAVLFSVICNSMPDKAWKSKLHDTGDMFDGMFIVGIETPNGQATYHYDIEPYWDMFKVKEFEKAPKWDGHTPADAIKRITDISADVVEVADVSEQIIRKQSEVTEYWKNDVKQYRAMKGYSDIEHDTDNFLRGYNEAVEDMLAILDGKEYRR